MHKPQDASPVTIMHLGLSLQQHARFDLTGKVGLVTGACKGIGAAIACGLADCGARVVVSSRKREAVAQTLRQAGHEAAAPAAGMGRMEETRALVNQAQAVFGGLGFQCEQRGHHPAAQAVT